MKARFLALALFGSLMLTFGFVAAACGGDGGGGGLTLEEYFQRLDELDNDLTEQSEAVYVPQTGNEDPAEIAEQLRDFLPQQAQLFKDFRDGLAALDPPAEAEDLHNEGLDALDDVIAGFEDVVGQLDGVESFEDIDALLNGGEFGAANERVTQVCLDAEQLAADNGITVDFDCGVDEPAGGGGATLEEYFSQLDEAENAFRIEQASSEADFASVDETTPLEDVTTLFEELQGVIDEFVAELEGIAPPPAAEAAHEETIAGFQAISQLIDEAIAAVDGGATGDELFAFFDSEEATQASDALDVTCNALQSLADDNGIAVDLSCQN